MQLCFYSRTMSLAASTKCHPTTLRIAYKHTCLFIHLLLSAIPRWKDRFIGAWENCSRSRLREFCTNRRIMPQAQTYTDAHIHTFLYATACGNSEAFSRGMWKVCGRCATGFPNHWPGPRIVSVFFFTLFMRFFVAADLIDNRKLRSAQTNVHTLSRWYILIIYCVPVTGDSPWSTIQRILSLLFSLSLSLILSLRNRYYSREYVNVSQRDAFLRRRSWQWTRRRAWTISRCMSITYDRYDMYAHDIVAFFFCMISHYALTVKKDFLMQKNASILNHEYKLVLSWKNVSSINESTCLAREILIILLFFHCKNVARKMFKNKY